VEQAAITVKSRQHVCERRPSRVPRGRDSGNPRERPVASTSPKVPTRLPSSPSLSPPGRFDSPRLIRQQDADLDQDAHHVPQWVGTGPPNVNMLCPSSRGGEVAERRNGVELTVELAVHSRAAKIGDFCSQSFPLVPARPSRVETAQLLESAG